MCVIQVEEMAKIASTTTTLKRKTPSELRGEQLKRKNIVELVDESPAPVNGSTSRVLPETKKSDPVKNPRYIDTRVDELFPARKNSIRLKFLPRNENVKQNVLADNSTGTTKSAKAAAFPTESHHHTLRPEDSITSTVKWKNHAAQACGPSEKGNSNTFRNVTDLSEGSDKLHGLSTVDMDKALRGLAAHEHRAVSASIAESSERIGNSKAKDFCSKVHVPCKMMPLDLTLKTSIRVVSLSSINWFHRLVNGSTRNGMARLTSSLNCSMSQDVTHPFEKSSTAQAVTPKFFHSWVHPQSPFPPSVISALTLSAPEGGQLDFLSQRQVAWEESFRSLFYMLRKNICSIFYVCTAQFVVMFTSSSSKKNRCICNAYISQSTRGLRSLLKEHDVLFSMPLCNSCVEEVSTEELVELSELEKQNLGQARRRDTMSDVDNKPQSLLAFTGNTNVHAMYDFLLNYRYFLTSLSGVDVPMIYSPIPFENAALSVPEVRCKEVRKADHVSSQRTALNVACDPNQAASCGMCYSVEVKDRYLPPWVTSAICDALSSSDSSFEASFTTEPASVGLNAGLNIFEESSDPQVAATEALNKNDFCFGIPNMTLCPEVDSAFVKGLKCDSDSSYTAFLSPV